MANVEKVLTTDVIAAENLLYEVLYDTFPEVDFRPGTALRDLVVKTLAYGLAFIESERRELEERTNLSSLSALSDANAVAAADALISNFLISRNDGSKSSGVITVYLTQKVDVILGAGTVFNKTSALAYKMATGVTSVIPSSDLTTVRDADGNAIEFFFNLPVVATAVGGNFDVPAGTWESWSPFSSYASRVENLYPFSNGASVESNLELIERARTAVTVRNLINTRSLDTVIRDTFPDVTKVVTVGATDDEMHRDVVTLGSENLIVHKLGYADIWVWLPLSEGNTVQGTVGLEAAPSSPAAGSGDFYAPWWTADEQADPSYYSRGIPLSTNIGGALDTPLYRVSTVSYLDSNNDLVYLERSNAANLDVKRLAGEHGLWRLRYESSHTTFSQDQSAFLEVSQFAADGATPLKGKQLTITYDTVTGLDAIHQYLENRQNRVVCANMLARAAVPVYIELSLGYVLRADATSVVDESAVIAAIATYINTLTTDLYVSNLVSFIMDGWGDQIESLSMPISIVYTLYSTEGVAVSYASTNKVDLDNATFQGEDDEFDVDPYTDPTPFSMSTRVMRLVAVTSNITFSPVT